MSNTLPIDPAPSPRSLKRSGADRRRFRRANTHLTGRFMDQQKREHACRTEDLSPGGACIGAPTPEIGSRVLLYLDRIGRIEAKVVRIDGPQRFAVVFEASVRQRERIAEALIVLLNETRLPEFELEGARRNKRYTGAGQLAVELEDGTSIDCTVLDFSLVGASLSCNRNPPRIGSWVRVGASYGRVARYLERGFAIDFQPRTTAPANF